MTHPGDRDWDDLATPIDPDDPDFDPDDPRIISGVARDAGADEGMAGPRSRRFARFQQEAADTAGSRKRKIMLFLVLALGAVLLALGLSSNCGGGDGGDEQSAQETATAEATASATAETATLTSTPKPAATSTPTSVITPKPVVTVQADTGDPLGLTGEGGGRGLRLLVATCAITFACAWTFWKQTGPSRPQT